MGNREGKAKVGRSLKSLGPDELADLAGAGADRKLPDTHLMLALFHSFDKKPDPAKAKRAFETARAHGAKPREIDALRTLGIEERPKEPSKPEEKPDLGFALDFNGTSDYAEIADKRSLHLRAFTVEAWVWRRPGDQGLRYVIAKNLGWDTTESFGIAVRDGRWTYSTGFGDEQDVRNTTAACPVGQWVHCALVGTGDERAAARLFFVDGKLVDRSRARRLWSYDDKPLTIGAELENNNHAFFWDGAIDEVRISKGARYRKDFDPERLLAPDRQTVLLLRLDESEGRAARDATKFKNHARVFGARFVRPGALKLPPPPKPPPPPPPPPPKK